MSKACAGCKPGVCSEKSQAICATLASDKLVPGKDDCADPTSACYRSYWQRRQLDPSVLAADRANPDAEQLRASLGLNQERYGEELLFVAMGGLQEFLQERAKTETITYAVSQLKGRVCAKHREYLEHTCALLDADDLNLDQATLVRLKKAATRDLALLPVTMVSKLPPAGDNEARAFRVFSEGAAKTAADLIESRLPLNELPEAWAKHARKAYLALQDGERLACSLQGEKPMPAACFALLLPELGVASAKFETQSSSVNDLAAVIERAAVSFCATYGPTEEREYGTCLLKSPEQLEKTLSHVKALARASFAFTELHSKAEALDRSGIPADEMVRRLLPDVALAFTEWNDALQLALPELAGAAAQLDQAELALKAAGAAAARDYPELLAVLAVAFEPGQPLATVKLPPEALASLGFAARLAAAKTPEDAKKVFEEEAAPLGSYRVKYARHECVTIAVNAFVGPFVGYGRYYQVEDDTDPGLVTRPISAPLGVDFTLLHSSKHHGGILLSVIDPFGAGTIDENSEAQDFEWGSVLAPGAFLRWGIGGSPFTLLGGLVYQPLARSKADCADDAGEQGPCWKGSLQLGGAVAIDIPLIVLR